MIKKFASAALAASASVTLAGITVLPQAAQADEARRFSHEGVTYIYSTEQKGAATIIKGRTSEGVPFNLTVSGDRVRGTYNGNAVNFTTAQAAEAGIQLR